MEITTLQLSLSYLSSASVHAGEHGVGVGVWIFGNVCLYWFTAWPGLGYIRGLGELVRSLTRLSSIYLYYYFRLNEDSSSMDALSSLISRREAHDATSDGTRRLATADRKSVV